MEMWVGFFEVLEEKVFFRCYCVFVRFFAGHS